ncbi:hypothetical protein BaRGS_00015628, partial [Batillaria attramentaria]
LLQCTNEPNVSIPQLADLLIERTQHSNWVVVYKSLITIHNLMNYGNERFTQYLASNNCSFNLGSFVDKAGVQGYDMSTFIRRYAKYLNEKAISYRGMAFDFCKVKRGKDDGLLRTMNAEKLLKSLPVLQQQLDALLEFDCTPNELTNGVINACFMLLFKDLIRLFACYNDGIINLLEKYFDMNKKQCKDALDLYKKFLVRMEKVSEFLKVAEEGSEGQLKEMSLTDTLQKAPASLLEALEQHLASMEGKKGVTTPAASTPKPAGFSSALSTMSTNSNAFNISETEKKKILEEESRQLQQLKASDSEPTPEADLFQEQAPDSDDTNVSVMATAYSAPPAASMSSNPFGAPPFQQTNGFAAAGSGSGFTSDADFARAFNSAPAGSSAALNFSTATVPATNQAPPGFDAFGDVLQPMNKGGPMQGPGMTKAEQPKLVATDLDSSLASLASNLSVNTPSNQIKKTTHQWQPKGESKLTGGTTYQQRPAMASSTTWTMPQQQYQPQPMMGAPGMGFGQPQMAGAMGAQPMMGMGQPMMMGPSMGAMPAMGMQPQPMMYGGMRMPAAGMPQQQPPGQNPSQDPFGALVSGRGETLGIRSQFIRDPTRCSRSVSMLHFVIEHTLFSIKAQTQIFTTA